VGREVSGRVAVSVMIFEVMIVNDKKQTSDNSNHRSQVKNKYLAAIGKPGTGFDFILTCCLEIGIGANKGCDEGHDDQQVSQIAYKSMYHKKSRLKIRPLL